MAKPGPHEVLIRTHACGLCHSDLHFIEGSYPHAMPCVAGHEAAGIVEDVGSDVRTVKKGDHVVTCLSAFCGHCEFCVTGRMALCLGAETRRDKGQPSRLTRDSDGAAVNQMLNLSAFAEMMLIHEHACVAIDRDMPLDRAAVIGCAVTTGFGVVNNDAQVKIGQSLVVFGLGGVGLSVVQAAGLVSAYPIVGIDILDQKLEMAKRFGATHLFNSRKTAGMDAMIREIVGSSGADVVIDTTGMVPIIEQAYELTQPSGKTILVGVPRVGDKASIYTLPLHFKKILKGSHGGEAAPDIDIPNYIRLLNAGRLRLDGLITHEFDLDKVNQAISLVKTGEAGRVVIAM